MPRSLETAVFAAHSAFRRFRDLLSIIDVRYLFRHFFSNDVVAVCGPRFVSSVSPAFSHIVEVICEQAFGVLALVALLVIRLTLFWALLSLVKLMLSSLLSSLQSFDDHLAVP